MFSRVRKKEKKIIKFGNNVSIALLTCSVRLIYHRLDNSSPCIDKPAKQAKHCYTLLISDEKAYTLTCIHKIKMNLRRIIMHHFNKLYNFQK